MCLRRAFIDGYVDDSTSCPICGFLILTPAKIWAFFRILDRNGLFSSADGSWLSEFRVGELPHV